MRNKGKNDARRLLALAIFVGGIAGAPGQSHAQGLLPGQQIRPDEVLDRGETILDRRRPRIAPLGIPAGPFLIFPGLSVRETFDTNIFRTEDDRESDFITTINPEIRAVTTWSNHQLNLRAGMEQGFYIDNDTENYTDYGAGIGGRLDVRRNLNLFGGFDFDNRHEERGSPDDVDGEEPTDFSILDGRVGAEVSFNRLTLTPEFSFRQFDFDDVAAGARGTINNDDRDRRLIGGSLLASYEIVPRFEAFLETNFTDINYDEAVDDAGFNRDGSRWQVSAGTDIDFTGITFGRISAGYEKRNIDDEQLEDFSGFSVRADIFSNPTTLMTVNLFALRESNETTQVGSSGLISTSVGLSVDYELLRSFLLGTDVIFSRNDFQDIDRNDNSIDLSLSADYQINRYVYGFFGYDFLKRSSSLDTGDFTANEVAIGFRLQY